MKFALPLVALVVIAAVSADQGLRRQELASVDAGSLPEAKVLAEKFWGKDAPTKTRLVSRQ